MSLSESVQNANTEKKVVDDPNGTYINIDAEKWLTMLELNKTLKELFQAKLQLQEYAQEILRLRKLCDDNNVKYTVSN